MDLNDTTDSVQSADASWVQVDEQDDSIHKLESLDPQKREKLEARFLGRSVFGVTEVSLSPSDDSYRGNKSRKRIFSDDDSKQGNSKHAKVDGCRRIDEFFGHSPSPRLVDSSSQTELTVGGVKELEEHAGSTQEVLRLKQRNAELEQFLSACRNKLDSTTARLKKCSDVTKDLLVKKCTAEQKEVRQSSVQNQLRLGRFNNQRQGAQFIEVWVDGYAFTDRSHRQQGVAHQREEIEKQRKVLSKRKPSVSMATSGGGGVRGRSKPEDGFAKPGNPSMSPLEYMEKEEVLKLRSAALKKEETTLQGELESLERERNVHVRELKRIAAEDSSRFNTHPTLHSRYLLLHLIGRGGFSEVYKAFDLQDYCYVACKIHQLNTEWREDKKANYIKHALREYNIHKKLDNPHIVRLFDVFEIDSNSFCTVLEYVDGQDLDFLLKQNRTLPEKEARTVIIQTMAALKYLNEIKPPVIHFDLKPGNILLGSGVHSFESKITDFGLSKIMENDSGPEGMELTSQGAGTYWYLPPECFIIGKEPPKISSKVDVWSVGVIFYQCLYGKKPFGHNLSQASILEQNVILRATDVDFPTKPAASNEAKSFIRRCLSYNKEVRPDVLSLCEDVYLKPKKQQLAGVTS